MTNKHFVVQGAVCQCKFSEKDQTDILQVKTQSIHFANDSKGVKNLLLQIRKSDNVCRKTLWETVKTNLPEAVFSLVLLT
ncbi:MAG: hypothetical protein WAM46_12755 [Flavobacterium sp.]